MSGASKHATVEREGFTVPLIGIPADATLGECECCHDNAVPLRDLLLNLAGTQFCCPPARAVGATRVDSVGRSEADPEVVCERAGLVKVRLWFIRETEKARLYCKLPPERNPSEEDHVWIPRSVCEHTTKQMNGQHIVEVADWFAERENL